MGANILFNSEVGGQITSTTISTYMSIIGKVVEDCLNWITSNPILMIFFVSGLVSVGFYVIRKAKRTAKA